MTNVKSRSDMIKELKRLNPNAVFLYLEGDFIRTDVNPEELVIPNGFEYWDNRIFEKTGQVFLYINKRL